MPALPRKDRTPPRYQQPPLNLLETARNKTIIEPPGSQPFVRIVYKTVYEGKVTEEEFRRESANKELAKLQSVNTWAYFLRHARPIPKNTSQHNFPVQIQHPGPEYVHELFEGEHVNELLG